MSKKQTAIIMAFAITIPRNPNKEEAIAVARLSRAGKGMKALPQTGTRVDGSNLAEMADTVEGILQLMRRAGASAHNRTEPE